MKTNKLVLLGLASVLLMSCQPAKDAWNSTELSLLDQYAYGVELPCYRIEGNSELHYDSEYECLTVTGAQVGAEELTTYANLLDEAGYELLNDYESDLYYYFEKEVEHEGITKYVSVYLYAFGEVYDEEYEENVETYVREGTFYLDVYNFYVYSWPETDINSFITDVVGADIDVPEVHADYYYVLDDYVEYFGGLYVDCYGVDENIVATYQSQLEELGWYVFFDDYYSTYVGIDPTNTLEVDFSLNDGIFYLSFYSNTYASYSDEDIIADYAANLGSEYAYDESFQCFYIEGFYTIDATTTTETIFNQALEAAPGYLISAGETTQDEYEDGSIGYSGYLSNIAGDILVDVYTYVSEGEVVLGIDVYYA